MQVYFSHSYRDVNINSYFIDRLVEEEIPLRADQKSDVWCVAKLERYMAETTGFLSIIPKRSTEKDAAAYSPYIGHELSLARRARVPRLLFVDEEVFKRHRLDFPEDAVTFRPDDLDAGKARHGEKIRGFRQALETVYRPARPAKPRQATVVAGEGRTLRSAAQEVAEILRREGYGVSQVAGRFPGRGLEDIRLLEMLWEADLCVFLLGERLSDVHIVLAMAHSHCIPSLRLQYDSTATDTNPSLSGLIRWRALDDMLVEFNGQLTSYQAGFVQPVEMALSSTSRDAVERLGTMKRRRPLREEDIWDIGDGPALIAHVHPNHTFVRDEVDRVRAQLNKALGLVEGREGCMEICALLYEGVRRRGYGYEIEQPTDTPGTQVIRSPTQIAAHATATCIDIACLFASLLEAAGQNPLIVVLEGPGFSHALAGYRVRGEPIWDNRGMGDLRGAVARRDALLFEATGAVHSDRPVGAENPEERITKVLSFEDARKAGEKMLKKDEVRLKHFVDVRALRMGNFQSQ
jgi:hypothetical protein